MRGFAHAIGRRCAPPRLPDVITPMPLLVAGLAMALVGGPLAAPTRASFGPIEIQSVDALEQAEEAREPAISGNGEYLAFQAALGGVEGIFRKDLRTGEIMLVAGGSIYSSGRSALIDASAPSISSDGRYVSFTSRATLVKAAQPGGNVYVRDMAIDPALQGPCTETQEAAGQCPYELASALNDSSEGITGGASASARVALSANGREIAFVLDGESNLMSGPGGSISTPAGQIAVRYLDSHKTVLVSEEREPGTGRMKGLPVKEGALEQDGAALSGDGSTVAWLGAHISAQAPTLEGERQQIEHDDAAPREYGEAYDEPLWRRIADGPQAPTRRMVGGGDPLAPGCPPGGTIEAPACQGPYPRLAWESSTEQNGSNYGWLQFPGYEGVPQLSYDGWTAALVGDPDGAADVFVVNMHEGLDRVQALRELTPEVPVPGIKDPGVRVEYLTTAGNVYGVAVSPDGSRIAFTTQRQLFPLAPLIYTEAPPAQLGVVELYEIVDGEDLERVTHGPDGGPSLAGGVPGAVTSEGAAAPSFSEDDLTVAFADTASNLVYGDANGASDVFTATEAGAPHVAGTVAIGSAPPGREPRTPQWRLSVAAVTHANGSATLDVVVPGAGRVNATATATVPVAVAGSATRARHGRTAGVAANGKRGRAVHKKTGSALERRPVADAQMSTEVPGLLELPLRVAGPYESLLRTTAGIYATVRVTFTGPGGSELSQTLAVSLHEQRPAKKSKRRATGGPAKAGGVRVAGRSGT